MKEIQFDEALERLERKIEQLDPDKPVRISEITGRHGSELAKAAAMLLQKYGITFEKGCE